MNGYAFEFDARGRIVQSKIYDRIGFRGDASNTLRTYVPQLQSFSDTTGFREFYKQNASTYTEQIAFYRDTANIAEMKKWLDKNFPTSSGYDVYKIVFLRSSLTTSRRRGSRATGFASCNRTSTFLIHRT